MAKRPAALYMGTVIPRVVERCSNSTFEDCEEFRLFMFVRDKQSCDGSYAKQSTTLSRSCIQHSSL